MEATRASLRDRILAGDLDDARVVVESLAEEFDVLDVAAAAVKLAHAAVAGEGGDREVEIPVAAPHVDRPERSSRPYRGSGPGPRPGRRPPPFRSGGGGR